MDYRKELQWKAVFHYYTPCDILKDSIFPLCLSVLICLIVCFGYEGSLLDLISKYSAVIWDVMANILSIMIAAFAIWISFYMTRTFDTLKKNAYGKNALNGLNASFLVGITYMVYCLIFSIVVMEISELKIPCLIDCEKYINIFVLFLLVFSSLSSIWFLKDVAKNLHNVAKYTILLNDIASKE